MEWIVGSVVAGLLVWQSAKRIELERRVKALEEKHDQAINSTAIMITELMKAALQLNQKIEAAKTEADETYYKKTDVA